ncbi:MAG TPA: trehalase family glycosidase, partial [Bacteroidales bacterium]|nr:trehalase family glycosidase [Bacteroidales bacterium]
GYDKERHLMALADVGLISLYIRDCRELAELARRIGRDEVVKELNARARRYRASLQTLWNEKTGLFLNKHLDTGKFQHRLSPAHFYPLLAEVPTQAQAERMINEHFFNPDEFWGDWILPSIERKDPMYPEQDYWRGRIWAPMNFLVYLGMQNYDLPQARRDLADKSRHLLMKEWRAKGYIRENYHAETGGDPNYRSEHFYHWGALLGMINMIEYEKTKSPMDLF